MSDIEWNDIASEAMECDPREFPYGYLTGGSFVLDSVRVFVWFRTIDDLIAHLCDVEPRIYDLEPGDGLEEYQLRVEPVLTRLRAEGLNEAIREQLNLTAKDAFVVDWWGTYAALRSGQGEIPRRVLDGFLGEERAGQALPEVEEEEFVEYLKTWGI